MEELLKIEMQNRMKTRVKRYLKLANFPTIRTLEEFDYRFQTSITKKDVNEWLTFSWIDRRANKILMGAPGVGKTHLALGTGHSAVHKGYKVIFFTMQTLMEDMIIAEKGGLFNDLIKKIMKNDLIIIDELGYIPFKPIYANLFFQFINSCYENKSIMITSNKLFNEWGTLFNDQTIATAILDRLLHHCEPIVLNGDSYRLKNVEGKI
jgi:DNA replication protein DnaC